MNRLLVMVVLLGVAGCGPAGETTPAGAPRFMPTRAAAPAPAPFASHLDYYGGPVMSHVKIVDVFWGTGLDPQVTAWAGPYFQAVTDSAYFDMLQEWNTTVPAVGGHASTNQTIYRGGWGGDFTIAPMQTTGNINDAKIVAELDRQITAGAIPPPDGDTLYMTFFPPAITVVDGTSTQCIDYCAYHNAFSRGDGSEVFYAVIPDMSSTCQSQCGPGDVLGNNANSASHELVEAVTDPQVDLNGTGPIGAPYAWIQGADGQEIGDLCIGQYATLPGGQLVQRQWSNAKNACIDHNDAYTPLPTPTPSGTPGATPTPTPAPGGNGAVSGNGCGCNLAMAEVPGIGVPLGLAALLLVLTRRRRG